MTSSIQQSTKKIQRATITVCFILSMFFVFIPKQVSAAAGAWGMSDIIGDFITNMMETVQRQIEGALLGTLKMAAIQMINSNVGQLLGGGSGGRPLFITNFNDFLYQTPEQNTALYMNDFFSVTTRGRSSSANYLNGADTGTVDYSNYLVDIGKRATIEKVVGFTTIDDYGGITAFKNGNPKAFNVFFSNPLNNPIGYEIKSTEVYEIQLAKEKKIAELKALAPGTLPSESADGQITAPATAIAAALNNAADIPNKLIAAAENPGQLLSGVVTSMANKLVTNMIQRGVGQVQAKISREIRNVNNKISGEIKTQLQAGGPARQFINTVNEIQKIKVKTPAPPSAIPSGL